MRSVVFRKRLQYFVIGRTTKMFWKKLKKKAAEKHNYDLTYDNVAIPEVHTHKPEDHEETPGEDAPVHYDNVAIPEVHIRRKK